MGILFSNKKLRLNIAYCAVAGGWLLLDIGWFVWFIWSSPLTNVKWHSDPWQTVTFQPIRLSTNFMTLIPSLIFTNYEWFPWTFATGVACQQGRLTFPESWFRPQLWDLLVLQWLRPDSANLPCLYSTFHLKHPLVLSRFCFQLCTSNCVKKKEIGRQLWKFRIWRCVCIIQHWCLSCRGLWLLQFLCSDGSYGMPIIHKALFRVCVIPSRRHWHLPDTWSLLWFLGVHKYPCVFFDECHRNSALLLLDFNFF